MVSVTSNEKAIVWREWKDQREARLGMTPMREPSSAARLVDLLDAGVYDLRDIAYVAEWLEHGILERMQGMAIAYYGDGQPRDAAARVGRAAGTRVGWSVSFRNARALTDMLAFLSPEHGEGVAAVVSFLAFVHRDSTAFARLNVQIKGQ